MIDFDHGKPSSPSDKHLERVSPSQGLQQLKPAWLRARSAVVAQRLIRRICKNCRESVAPSTKILESIQSRPDFPETIAVLQRQGILRKTYDGLAGIRLYHGKGCAQCQGSGFVCRVCLFELFEIDEDIRDLIMQRKPASFIRSTAIMKGMKTMFQDGLAKAFMGETTIEEVFRVAL